MALSSTRPIIGITMGDPLGIGPEILIKALDNPDIYSICRPIVLGDAGVLSRAVTLVGASVELNPVPLPKNGLYSYKTIDFLKVSDLQPDGSRLSSPTPETGAAMEKYILTGIDLAMTNQINGLVTCPITKTAMKLAGSKFHGHTELLAHHTQTRNYAMMLSGDTLKVVLSTIHIPLSQVPDQLSVQNILQTIELTHTGLKDRFDIKSPRIGVAGLNPHAGEEQMFGPEETAVISPAVSLAKDKGINATGPLPPDTAFYQAANQRFDAVVCMYHDQGLIPFKLIHFKDGVNTTLGLPIIRTSVDHGTAYDIAWQGIADSLSLEQAIKMAAFQAVNTQRNPPL